MAYRISDDILTLAEKIKAETGCSQETATKAASIRLSRKNK
jgi:hypothetical protein